MSKKLPISEYEVSAILDGNLDLWDFIPGTKNTYLDVLTEYYADEMPYGVAKARDGDPDQWIFERLDCQFA